MTEPQSFKKRKLCVLMSLSILAAGCAPSALEGMLGSTYNASTDNKKISIFGGVVSEQIGERTYTDQGARYRLYASRYGS